MKRWIRVDKLDGTREIVTVNTVRQALISTHAFGRVEADHLIASVAAFNRRLETRSAHFEFVEVAT